MLNLLSKLNNYKLSFFITLMFFYSLSEAKDFESLYQLALKNSPDIKISKSEVLESEAELKSSNSNFLPRVGVETRYENFDSEFDNQKGESTHAYVEWNLFNGFKDSKKRKSLRANLESVKIHTQRTQMNLKALLQAKYFKTKSYQDQILFLKNIMNLQNLNSVKQRKSVGRVLDSDFIEFELFEEQLKLKLIELERVHKESLAELEVLTGVTLTGNLTTSIQIKELDFESLNIAELLNSEKSKLKEEQLKVSAALENKKSEQSGYLPQIDLKATYGTTSLRESTDLSEKFIGISAKWELFSGFETTQNVRTSNAKLEITKSKLEQSKIYFSRRAEYLKDFMKSVYLNISKEEEKSKKLNLFLSKTQDDYKKGVKDSNGLKSAIELVLDAKLSFSNMTYQYLIAKTELQEILGVEFREK